MILTAWWGKESIYNDSVLKRSKRKDFDGVVEIKKATTVPSCGRGAKLKILTTWWREGK